MLDSYTFDSQYTMNMLRPLEAMKARNGHHLSIVDFESALPRTLDENTKALRYVVKKVNYYIDKGVPLDNLSLHFIENQCWIKITTKAINGIYGFKVNIMSKINWLAKTMEESDVEYKAKYDDTKIDIFTIYNLSDKQDEPIVPLNDFRVFYVYDNGEDKIIKTPQPGIKHIVKMFHDYSINSDKYTYNLLSLEILNHDYCHNSIIKRSYEEFKKTYEMRVFGFTEEFRYL